MQNLWSKISCDLQKKWNYFDFNQLKTFFFRILKNQYLILDFHNFKEAI